jgi:two-component system, chemotaxis family, chemotaxis protein CheY
MSYNILIVDDSRTVRMMIDKTLRLTDIPLSQVHHAQNGCEAIELLADEWIDLVLTDINMPEMDGVELIRRMRTNSLLERTPVVIVSTEGSQTRIDQLLQQGVQGYIRKPFTPEAIREVVENVLAN